MQGSVKLFCFCFIQRSYQLGDDSLYHREYWRWSYDIAYSIWSMHLLTFSPIVSFSSIRLLVCSGKISSLRISDLSELNKKERPDLLRRMWKIKRIMDIFIWCRIRQQISTMRFLGILKFFFRSCTVFVEFTLLFCFVYVINQTLCEFQLCLLIKCTGYVFTEV